MRSKPCEINSSKACSGWAQRSKARWKVIAGCWVLGNFQQSGVGFGIERTVGAQTAENNTVGTQFTANPNVFRHSFQFPFGIQEIATSRTNNHVQASRLQTLCRTLVEHAPRLLDFAIRRCRSTLGDPRTQLHAVGTAQLCRPATLHAVRADLKLKFRNHRFRHKKSFSIEKIFRESSVFS